ncbi:MAG TPA: xanthine dehydrogenase family protein molybdopterin-binding subunit [Thermomicrobiales bacterium]|nr:xanthine dehydrogenase family protein molybdopterin-binding subunit [Thermomicrobiales bacterium]
MTDTTAAPRRLLGQSAKRVDGDRKVLGVERFTGDLKVPGMLYARPVPSPYPHAQIVNVDKSAALAAPGVVAVVTADDLAVRRPLSALPGKSPLSFGEVSYVGQWVAVVLAETDQQARDALDLVDVTYEELPFVANFAAGMVDGAPPARLIAGSISAEEAAAHNADAGKPKAKVEEARSVNISNSVNFERGDVATAFANSAATAEILIRSDAVHQGYMEPQICLVAIDALGKYDVYTSTQAAFMSRGRIADWLDIPLTDINVHTMAVGGAFGGKFILIEPIAAALAATVQRPILLEFGRTDELASSNPAPACEIAVKVGATADGTLTAIEGNLTYDTGSLAGSPLGIAAILLGGYYKFPNLKITGQEVLTNRASAGSYRAPGAQQASFAIESAMDDLADKLGLDPLEFRLKNCAEEGDLRPNGGTWSRIGLRESLEALRAHPAWVDRTPTTAIAVGGWPGGTEPATAICRMDQDGTLSVVVGSSDISGVTTGFQMIAAEVIGVDREDMRVVNADTATAGFAASSGGSKVTYAMGSAVLKAAENARAQILAIAAQQLEASAEDLEIANGRVQVRGVPDASITLKEIASLSTSAATAFEPVYGSGSTSITESAPAFTVHLADVSVDEETGEVTIKRYVAVQDVGFAINPALIEDQMIGGVAQGIGWALHEAIEFDDDGQLITGTLLDYVLPRAEHIPEIETVIVEVASKYGPFGAKGVGEPPAIPGPAAIRNAIKRASGAKLSSLPMRPERVLAALRER